MKVAMSIVYFKTFWLGLHKEADRLEGARLGWLVDGKLKSIDLRFEI